MRSRGEERPHPADPAEVEAGGTTQAAVTAAQAEERPVEEGEEPSPASITLLEPEEEARFKERWRDLQTDFVDDPRAAVRQADALVSELTERLTDRFTLERDELERQWEDAGDVSTETLRVAVRRYRTFFERLLAI